MSRAAEEDDLAATERTQALLADLERIEGIGCAVCAERVCGHEAVMSTVLGFKVAPMCAPCLAGALGRELAELTDHVIGYIDHHDCFRTGWLWASDREGVAPEERPRCLSLPSPVRRPDDGRAQAPREGDAVKADAEWDAGSMSCGDLVLELRMRLRRMAPGQILAVTATDSGAKADLPAWCGLTSNPLRKAEHPLYFIERKKEE